MRYRSPTFCGRIACLAALVVSAIGCQVVFTDCFTATNTQITLTEPGRTQTLIVDVAEGVRAGITTQVRIIPHPDFDKGFFPDWLLINGDAGGLLHFEDPRTVNPVSFEIGAQRLPGMSPGTYTFVFQVGVTGADTDDCENAEGSVTFLVTDETPFAVNATPGMLAFTPENPSASLTITNTTGIPLEFSFLLSNNENAYPTFAPLSGTIEDVVTIEVDQEDFGRSYTSFVRIKLESTGDTDLSYTISVPILVIGETPPSTPFLRFQPSEIDLSPAQSMTTVALENVTFNGLDFTVGASDPSLSVSPVAGTLPALEPGDPGEAAITIEAASFPEIDTTYTVAAAIVGLPITARLTVNVAADAGGEGEGEGEGDAEFDFTAPSVGAAEDHAFVASGVVLSGDGDAVTAGTVDNIVMFPSQTTGFIAEAEVEGQSLDFESAIADELSEETPANVDIEGLIAAPSGYLTFGALRRPNDVFEGYLYRTDMAGAMQWASSPMPEELPGNWSFADAMVDGDGFVVLGTRFNGATERNVFLMDVDDTGMRTGYSELPIDGGVLAEAVGFAPAADGGYAIAANRAGFTSNQGLFIVTQPVDGAHEIAIYLLTNDLFYRSIAPLANGNFALAAETRLADFRSAVQLSEIDPDAMVAWVNTFAETTASVTARRIRVAPDGTWVVAGMDVDSSPGNEGPVTAGYLARYDVSGTPRQFFSRRFGPGDSNRFEDFVFDASGNVVAVGSTSTPIGGGEKGDTGGTRAYVVRTALTPE